MKPTHALRVAAALLLLSAPLGGQSTSGGQSPPAAERVPGRESTDVTAIMVDVVVRDRRGEPVRDLRPEEFEILEDGVRQEIGSVTPVFRDAPEATAAAAAAAPAQEKAPGAAAAAAAASAPEIIALVFDRLSPDARALAHKAALAYVGDGAVSNNTIAVFGIDISLIFYQTFTRDAGLIRQAIATAGGRGTSQYGSSAEQRTAIQQRLTRASEQQAAAGADGGGAGAANAGGAGADAQFALMQQRMLEGFDALERDQQGYSTSNALMAIVSAMRAIPGRKSVVFFSEGLAIPPYVQSQFRSVIDAANRANVSIYPMDAAGLRTDSPLKQTTEGVQSAVDRALSRDPSRDVTGRPLTEGLERNEDLLRADPHSGLGQLADETGGFLIANTNDLRTGFGRIDTDMRNYYMLTYVPSNTTFDGKFRQIEVKVRRPGVHVRARKGYYAVRSTGAPVLAHEAPAIALLEKTPVPNAFPIRAAALRFPEASRPGLHAVLVDVPAAHITFTPAPDGKTYTSDFLVLVRFKDPAGQVIERMSQRYQLQGPIDQIDRAKLGDILFYREPDLPAGVYTMETVVYDALSTKGTVRLSTIEVPETDLDGLRASSLTLVRRTELVPESERVPGSPLYVGEHLVYPNLGEPLRKGRDTELGFYFVVYPAQGGGNVTATLELLRNAKAIAQAPLQLAPPEPDGRILQVSRLPVDALEPGTYEVGVILRQGETAISRKAQFRIVQ